MTQEDSRRGKLTKINQVAETNEKAKRSSTAFLILKAGVHLGGGRAGGR